MSDPTINPDNSGDQLEGRTPDDGGTATDEPESGAEGTEEDLAGGDTLAFEGGPEGAEVNDG